MSAITRELLAAYLDDALGDVETAQVEQALRQSDGVRTRLVALQQEQDRGEHSIGAVWRRQRITCPSREQLGSYLLGVLEPDLQDYVTFHLEMIACPFCQANLTDMKSQQAQAAPVARRRKRYFDSSAGLLKK